MPPHDSLPYRPCVGTMVLNRDGLVFIGRRTEGPEHVDLTHVWQMPQGGIDKGEDPWPAALRELHEETNIRSVKKLAEMPDWLDYDLPPDVAKQAWKGRIAGRRRNGTRCASPATTARSTSSRPPAATSRNSSNGAGSRCATFPDLVIPFKREVYQRVVDAFAHLVRA